MIVLWTDGSAIPNPGAGGFAVLRERSGRFSLVELGAEEETTNIKMEGTALKKAMEYILKEGDAEAEIHTDSQFWVKVLTDWAPKWEKNRWRKSSRKPIENLELVKELYGLYGRAKPELIFGYGHQGVTGNELADEWADKARKGMTMEKIKESINKEAS